MDGICFLYCSGNVPTNGAFPSASIIGRSGAACQHAFRHITDADLTRSIKRLPLAEGCEADALQVGRFTKR